MMQGQLYLNPHHPMMHGVPPPPPPQPNMGHGMPTFQQAQHHQLHQQHHMQQQQQQPAPPPAPPAAQASSSSAGAAAAASSAAIVVERPEKANMSVEEAEKLGIPCIVPLRFWPDPLNMQSEVNDAIKNDASRKIVLKKSAHARSELTPTARLNLVMDAIELEKCILRAERNRMAAGAKRCVGHVTNEKYRAASVAKHYQVSVATVRSVVKLSKEKPILVASSKSTRGRKRTRHDGPGGDEDASAAD